MDNIDKKIEKLNKKKQKKLEKEKKLQEELDALSDNELLYFKGLYAGMEISSKNKGLSFNLVSALAIGTSIALASPIVSAIFAGIGFGCLVAGSVSYTSSLYHRKKWQTYNTASINREIKKRTEEYQKAKEVEKTLTQTENLVSKTTKVVESKENEVNI